MRKYSKKRVWSFIGFVVLIVLAVTLIISLIPKKTDDGYKKVKTDWAIGSLISGQYIADNSVSLVSDYIEINEGFRIVIDFDKDCSFGYVFYDANKEPVNEGLLQGPCSKNITVEDFSGQAKYIRVVICELDDADDHINAFEKWEYGNYITIYTLEETEDE